MFELSDSGSDGGNANPFDCALEGEQNPNIEVFNDALSDGIFAQSHFDAALDSPVACDDVEEQAEARSTDEVPVVRMLNFMARTQGERVLDAEGHVAARSGIHPRLITAEGVIRKTFGVRTPCSQAQDVFGSGSATHYLDEEAAVFHFLLDAQRAGWLEKAKSIQYASERFLIVQHKWDEATHKLAYGPELFETLLQWVHTALCRKYDLDDEVRQLLESTLRCEGHGPLSVFAQRLTVSWGLGSGEIVDIIIPPKVIERKNNTCMLQALDSAFPDLSLAELANLALVLSYVAVVLVKDGAKANRTLAKRLMARVSALPHNVFVFETDCIIHAVFGALKFVLAFGGHLSPLFSASNLLHLADYHVRLVKSLMFLIFQEIDYTIVAEWSEPPRPELEALLNRTLCRHHLTNARQCDLFIGVALAPPSQEPEETNVQKLRDRALKVFNAPIARQRAGHNCVGRQCCPGGRYYCACVILDLIINLLLRRLPKVLALSKWTSSQENISWWDLAHGLFGLLTRAWLREWPLGSREFEAAARTADVGYDFNKVISERLKSTSEWIAKALTFFTLAVVNIIAIPIDKFIAIVSSADDASRRGELREPLIVYLLKVDGGLLSSTMGELASLLEVGSRLFDHLLACSMEVPEVDQDAWWSHHAWISVTLVLAVYAKMWVKRDQTFDVQPLPLFSIVDLTASRECREQSCRDFWDTNLCCMQPSGRRIRLLLLSWRLLLEGSFISFWTRLAWILGISVADIERDNGTHYHISKSGPKSPAVSVERLAMQAFFEQYLANYRKRGGNDPRTMLKSVAASLGMFAKKGQRRKRAPVEATVVLYYINRKLPRVCKVRRRGIVGGPGWSASQTSNQERRKELAREFHALSPDMKAKVGRDYEQAKERAKQKIKPSGAVRMFTPWWGGVDSITWPVKPHLLKQYVNRQLGGGRLRGITPAGRKLRGERMKNMIVADPGADSGSDVDEVVEASVDAPCAEKHPGLCVKDDAAHIADALKIAARLHVFLMGRPRGETLGSCWCLQAVQDNDTTTRVFILCCYLQHNPRLAAFMVCSCGSLEEFTFSDSPRELSLCNDERSMAFETSFGIVGAMFRKAACVPTEVATMHLRPLKVGLLRRSLLRIRVSFDLEVAPEGFELYGPNPLPDKLKRPPKATPEPTERDPFVAALDASLSEGQIESALLRDKAKQHANTIKKHAQAAAKEEKLARAMTRSLEPGGCWLLLLLL